MGLDLDAIRKKLNKMSGNRVNKIKFVDGKQRKLRIIAFPDNDGQPFKERLAYDIGKNWGLLALSQYGENDPIKELTDSLRDRTGKDEAQAKEDWKLAKKLFAKIKHHAIVIDRDDEAAGPQIWQFTQSVAKRLYQIFLDEDYGDISDIHEGFDLKVTRTKEDNGFRSYTIDPRPRPAPLHKDADTIEKWTEATGTIDIDRLFKKKTYEELDQMLQAFLNGDDEQEAGSTGTERGGKSESSGSTDAEAASGDVGADESARYEDLDKAFEALEQED